MDALKAINMHRAWKDRFITAISAEEIINVAIVGSDLCCDFGEWLYSEGRQQFGHRNEWRNCLLTHAEFHIVAAEVAKKINDRCYFEADQMISSEAMYSKKSAELEAAITIFFNSL